MTDFMLMIYIFLQNYLVPFLFSIGLFYFVYAIVEYFIIGKGGDEERMQHGRELFLKSIGWFLIAMIAHVFVLILGWISASSFFSPPTPTSDSDVEIRRDTRYLPVPNVPVR
ncbi:MAG: hypothetical protein WD605_01560 [Candidatus Paceibacterota bacterium]